MNKLENNLTREITVVNELGLHARPAAKIAELAAKAASNVWLIKNGEKVDASSVIDILSLCGTKGTRLTIQTERSDDKIILKQIVDLFEQGFKEP
ncbi:MAG: HPr family phosphocarrier protein [Desulfobacterales bacterium]|jgi:phosphocarrier protein|nr:HPr family phosphocarrier protein [Desulfobacterales bacterium]